MLKMMKAVFMLAVASFAISAVAARSLSDDKNLQNLLERLLEKRDRKPCDKQSSKESSESSEELECGLKDINKDVKSVSEYVKDLVIKTTTLFDEAKTRMEGANGDESVEEKAVVDLMTGLTLMEDKAKCADKLLKQFFNTKKDPLAKCSDVKTYLGEFYIRAKSSAITDACTEIGTFALGFEMPFYKDFSCITAELNDIKSLIENGEATEETLIAVRRVGHDIHRMVRNLHSFGYIIGELRYYCSKQTGALPADNGAVAAPAPAKRTTDDELIAKLEKVLKDLKENEIGM